MVLKNVCFRAISQLTYPIIFSSIIMVCIFCKGAHKSTIPVSNTNTFDEENDPKWIAHMTDLHISQLYPDAIENAKNSFNFINQFIKPPFLLITGDIADNYKRKRRPCESLQIDSQFQAYNDLIKSSGVSEYTFETIGNHDVVGIKEDLAKNNQTNFNKYFNINETSISTVREKNNVRIISFNPVDFTSGTGLIGLIKKIDSHNLDELEKVITANCQSSNNTESDETKPVTIIASHYATSSLYPQKKTSSGATFGELFEKCNIKYFINGHLHPKSPLTMHHQNGFIEITGIPTKLYEGFAVFSVDNGHSNYVHLSTNNNKPAVVTYPVPSIYENEIMSEFSGVVRLISFSDKANQFKATIKNHNTKEIAQCDLQFIRNLSEESEGHSPRLFQCAISKSSNKNFKGKNTLRIEGDLEEVIEFNVDEPLKVTEKHSTLFNGSGFVVGISLAIVYHVTIFLGMIFPFDHEYFYEYSEHPIFCLLLGPIITGFRMKKLEMWAKLVIAICILGPIFLPIGFFFPGGESGLLIFWGYSIRGGFIWDTFLLGLGTFYFFTVAISIEEVFIVVLTKWKISYYADVAVASILYLFGLVGWYYVGFEICYGPIWIASLPFFIFPIVTVVCAVIHRPLKKRRKILEAERERRRDNGYDDNLLSEEKGDDDEINDDDADADKRKKKRSKKKNAKRKSKKKDKNETVPSGNVPEPSVDVPEP